MSSGERIASTGTGDILGSRWGRPALASEPRRPTPQPAATSNGGGDIIGSRRATSPQKRQPSEPIISTIDEGDIIGRHRWVPRIDHLESSSPLIPSRHATPTPSATTSHASPAPPASSSSASADLNKLKRLIDRLSWKSHTLLYTQHVALTSPVATASAAAAPSSMFKLDFFEYYTLLERILVLLLARFRVPVPAATLGATDSKGSWGHRYHESVLEAIEKPGTPVSEALGGAEVRAALRRAKGFRNRWKDADEQVVPAWECQREDILELRLEELVEVVLGALERVYRVAEQGAAAGGESNGTAAAQSGQGTWGEQGQQGFVVDEDMEDAPWEAVGDAMEDVMDMDVE